VNFFTQPCALRCRRSSYARTTGTRLFSSRSKPAPLRECPFVACAVHRRRFPVDEAPTRQSAPAGSNRSHMEVTEVAEAFDWRSRIVTGANVPGRTRVKRRASLDKGPMCRPTPTAISGKAEHGWAVEAKITRRCYTGVWRRACTQGKRTKHGKPKAWSANTGSPVRDRAGRPGVGGEVRSTAGPEAG